MKTKKDIYIPNIAVIRNTEFTLTPEELYAFSGTQSLQQHSYTEEVVTTVDMLAKVLRWEQSKQIRTRIKVEKVLKSLQDKGYISIKCDGDMKKELLYIKFNPEYLK